MNCDKTKNDRGHWGVIHKSSVQTSWQVKGFMSGVFLTCCYLTVIYLPCLSLKRLSGLTVKLVSELNPMKRWKHLFDAASSVFGRTRVTEVVSLKLRFLRIKNTILSARSGLNRNQTPSKHEVKKLWQLLYQKPQRCLTGAQRQRGCEELKSWPLT